MLIEWNKSYSVGIDTFDGHHQNLFNLLNELVNAIKEKRKNEAIAETLDELVKYTNLHFSAEEAALEKNGYPEYEKHKAEHNELTTKVDDFHQRFRNNEALITTELIGFIYNWLKNHIAQTDKNYETFLKEKGVN